MIKKIGTIVLLLLFSINSETYSKNSVFLVYKINNQIITNIDVENEKKYLLALNNNLESVDNDQLINIAKESLQKELIKRIELSKYYVLGQDNEVLDRVLSDLYNKIGFKSEKKFQIYLNSYGLKISDIKEKIEIESTWNQMIYSLFKDKIYIDKQKLKKKINERKINNKSYLLSEIVFENMKQGAQEENVIKIQQSIDKIGFENTANLFSISESKKLGGKIGWVEGRLLTDLLITNIQKLNIGENTLPINMGANSLILKVEDFKIEELKIDKKKEFEKLLKFETNKQLERFSLIHYNRIKLNTIVDVL